VFSQMIAAVSHKATTKAANSRSGIVAIRANSFQPNSLEKSEILWSLHFGTDLLTLTNDEG